MSLTASLAAIRTHQRLAAESFVAEVDNPESYEPDGRCRAAFDACPWWYRWLVWGINWPAWCHRVAHALRGRHPVWALLLIDRDDDTTTIECMLCRKEWPTP